MEIKEVAERSRRRRKVTQGNYPSWSWITCSIQAGGGSLFQGEETEAQRKEKRAREKNIKLCVRVTDGIWNIFH